MSSEIENLVEAITELVLKELDSSTSASEVATPPRPVPKNSGMRVLVAAGPKAVEDSLWQVLGGPELAPSALVWSGGREDQLPSSCRDWKLEARAGNWAGVVSGYQAVVLLGCDLGVLASIANFGSDGSPPSSVAVAALAAGKPVFLDNHHYEQFRRHSSRLASGFVRRFEEFYRMVSSFGVEFGGAERLGGGLSGLGGNAGFPAGPAARAGGRDVVTVEDVEAVRRSGSKQLQVAMGTIVTPLAAQRASEWGIEVSFQ